MRTGICPVCKQHFIYRQSWQLTCRKPECLKRETEILNRQADVLKKARR